MNGYFPGLLEGKTMLVTDDEPMMADPKFNEFAMSMVTMRKLATLDEFANDCNHE